MATTKRKTPTSSKSTTKRSATKRKTPVAKNAQDYIKKTKRAATQQPYVTAAIATGAVAAIAAAAAGAYFFRRSEKTMGEIADDLGTRMKDGFNEAVDYAAETGRTMREKATMFFNQAEDQLSQSEIAEEALTLKETGRNKRRPVDDTIKSELKTGAVSY